MQLLHEIYAIWDNFNFYAIFGNYAIWDVIRINSEAVV